MNYFTVLLDLLNIPVQDTYLAVAQAIESSPKKHLRIFHPYAYLFSAFQQYVLGTLPLEDLMKIGDITSEEKISFSHSDGRFFLEGLLYATEKNDLSAYENTLFIFDKGLSTDIKKTSSALEKVGSALYFC